MDTPNQLQAIVRVCTDRAGGSLVGRYATFDFDNSCIVNDIQEATLAYACKKFLLKDDQLSAVEFSDNDAYHRDVFLAYHKLLEENKVKEAYFYAVKTLAGFTAPEIDALVADVIRSDGDAAGTQSVFGLDVAKGLAVRPQIKMLMELLLAAQCKVYVVTASSEEVVRSALTIFGFSDVPCIGVKNKEVDGVFSEEIEEPAPVIEGKVDCIKKFISETDQPILAVGDSMNDLPMLEYSEVKVVVNRENALSRKAQEEGWYLI